MPTAAFKRALRSSRLTFSMTEEQAANAVGVSVHTWRSYERRNGRSPTLVRLIRIVEVFGPAPIDALLRPLGFSCRKHEE